MMKITNLMLKATDQIWNQYNLHSFVLGIQNGTLDQSKFRFYMIQDYLYLKDYAKIFGIGLAKAKSNETASLFTQYIAAINNELNIHGGYMELLQISSEEIAGTQMSLTNLSYTSYMLRVAYEEGEAEILAAVLSCAYSYEVIARRMIQNKPDCIEDPFYGEWIREYASDAYHEENRVLLEMMDQLTGSYTDAQKDHLVDIFYISSRYEMLFWDMAWECRM